MLDLRSASSGMKSGDECVQEKYAFEIIKNLICSCIVSFKWYSAAFGF